MENKKFSIRRFRMSDVDGVVKLLRLVFNVDFSREWWHWKYKANPAGFWGEQGDIWVAESEDEIVGCWGVLPVKMKFGPRTITVAQSVDAATHPEYRRQGISKNLSKNVCLDIQNRYDFIFGFPGKIPLKYRMKQGWKTLPLSEFLIFLNYDRPLRNYFKNKLVVRLGKTALRAYIAGRKLISRPSIKNGAAEFIEIEKVNYFPNEVDDFWRQVRSEYEMCVERTVTFLNWRFSKHLGDYHVFIARSADTKNVTGYLVLKETKIQSIKNVLDVVDLQTLLGDYNCALDLIDAAIKFANDKELDSVHFRVPTWHMHAKILSKRGAICINHALKLLRIHQPHATFLEFKNVGLIPKIQSWFYTLADTDYA
jgi:GNAT superfamily N-acetyltransferase